MIVFLPRPSGTFLYYHLKILQGVFVVCVSYYLMAMTRYPKYQLKEKKGYFWPTVWRYTAIRVNYLVTWHPQSGCSEREAWMLVFRTFCIQSRTPAHGIVPPYSRSVFVSQFGNVSQICTEIFHFHRYSNSSNVANQD